MVTAGLTIKTHIWASKNAGSGFVLPAHKIAPQKTDLATIFQTLLRDQFGLKCFWVEMV
jgi:hypothetical protein